MLQVSPATITCQRKKCKRSFHFPRGRENGCVSQFFGQYRPWYLLLCSSCAAKGTHRCCSALNNSAATWECEDCAGVSAASSRQPETAGPSTAGQAASSRSSPAPETSSRPVQTGPERRAGRSRMKSRAKKPYSRP